MPLVAGKRGGGGWGLDVVRLTWHGWVFMCLGMGMRMQAEREARRKAFHEFLARQTQRELHKKKKMEEVCGTRVWVWVGPGLIRRELRSWKGRR